MSSSPARRRRLAVARAFPQATCSVCGASLARVEFPLIHLERCERLAAERAAAAPTDPTPARRSTLSAIAAWARAVVGMSTRGAGS